MTLSRGSGGGGEGSGGGPAVKPQRWEGCVCVQAGCAVAEPIALVACWGRCQRMQHALSSVFSVRVRPQQWGSFKRTQLTQVSTPPSPPWGPVARATMRRRRNHTSRAQAAPPPHRLSLQSLEQVPRRLDGRPASAPALTAVARAGRAPPRRPPPPHRPRPRLRCRRSWPPPPPPL